MQQMIRIYGLILYSLFLMFFLTIQAYGYDSSQPEKRIVGGEIISDNATQGSTIDNIDQWPWVVSLSEKNFTSPFCGASLIANQWLLTAAHCVYDLNTGNIDKNLQIEATFLKADLYQNNSKGFQRNIANIIIHPDYNYNLNTNDIALLMLDSPVTSISPVQLPGSSYDSFTVAAGTMSTVLGWGNVSEQSTNIDGILRKVEIPITEQSICKDSMAKFGIDIVDSMICAGDVEGGKDSCQGDSGGPLVYFSEPVKSWVQTGIVSFGIGCAEPNIYGIYTRISKFTAPKQLINETICDTHPITPTIQITQINQNFTINFSTPNNDQIFRLYYAPYPAMTPIKYIDVLGNNFSATLALGSAYYIAAQSRKDNCISPFSEIKTINL